MHHVVEDTLFGFRLLRRTPGWTAAVVLSLGLGIGLSTAIFSVVYGVLLQPLPYPAPHRLVAIWPSAPNQAYQRFNVNAALWMHWREHTNSFEEIALTRHIANFNLTGEGAPERLQGARASANLNRVLGVQPAMGRMFTEEERLGDVKVAVLSHRLW
ncbi:MAG TPA: ABC transporter permease, partial [Bryobacteraceae bacterium]|nr:ABC transporter permease [Bryobacteraceae bacterium]